MDKIKTQTIYQEVPENTDHILETWDGTYWNTKNLEKQEDQVCMSREDFLKAIGDAFEAGAVYQYEYDNVKQELSKSPDKEEYISNLIKQ